MEDGVWGADGVDDGVVPRDAFPGPGDAPVDVERDAEAEIQLARVPRWHCVDGGAVRVGLRAPTASTGCLFTEVWFLRAAW